MCQVIWNPAYMTDGQIDWNKAFPDQETVYLIEYRWKPEACCNGAVPGCSCTSGEWIVYSRRPAWSEGDAISRMDRLKGIYRNKYDFRIVACKDVLERTK